MNNRTFKRMKRALTLGAFVGASMILSQQSLSSPLPPGRSIGIEKTPLGWTLSLPTIQDACYDIETKSNLTVASWQYVATVTGEVGRTDYPLLLPDAPSRFFRAIFPQPAVTAGEPAYLTEEGGVLYITGQYFYDGDTVRLGGIPLTDVVFVSHTLLRATVGAMPPGLYTVEVVNSQGGAVLGTQPAAVEIAPPAYRTLQEPPEWPPAGPSPSYKKIFRGHVTLLKAFDDEEPDVAARKHTKTGHVTILKAFDDEAPETSLRKEFKGHVTLLKAIDDQEPETAARKHTKTGHVTILKAFDDEEPTANARKYTKTGHVTLLKAFDDEDPSASLRGIDKKDIRRCGETGLPMVRLHSGEVQVRAVDVVLEGRGLDVVWQRTYRSRTGQNTTQGQRWSHSYDVRCVMNGEHVDVQDGTGRRDTYRLQPDSTYACPGQFREGLFTNGAFRLVFADTGFWEFNPLDASPAAGKLARIQDRNGNAILLHYVDGRLMTLEDTLGRLHSIAYNADGRIESVTDSTGRTVTYTYYGAGDPAGAPGDLRSVTSPPVTGTPNGNDFPLGKTTVYTYTQGYADPQVNHLLLTVTEPSGDVSADCLYNLNSPAYAYLRCESIQYGSETKACLYYQPQTPSPDNRFAAMRTIINDPIGNVVESFFDIRNRCVTQREYTGRAVPGLPVTASENRPSGKLRSEDPDLYETQLTWNNDSLCTRVVLPSGLTGTFVHGGDANPSARMRSKPEILFQEWEDPLKTRGADTDGDGVPDLFKVAWSYTYDPRFGSEMRMGIPPAIQGVVISNMRTRVKELEAILKGLGLLARFDGDNTPIIRGSALGGLNTDLLSTSQRKGWNGKIKGSGVYIRDQEQCDDFVVSSADLRGTTVTQTFDAKGNPISTSTVSILFPPEHPTTVDRVFNGYGQLVAVTNAPDAQGRRRVDVFAWNQGHLETLTTDAAPGGVALSTSFERDSRGNVTRVVDPDGHDTLYTYNALDQLMTCSSPPMVDGTAYRVVSTLYYDANDHLARVDTDHRQDTGALVAANPSWTTRFSSTPLGNCVEIETEVDASTTVTNRFEYSASGCLTTHLRPAAVSGLEPGNVTHYAYDERGLPYQIIHAPGSSGYSVMEYAYTSDGRLASKRLMGEPVESYTYDGLGRLSTITDAMGNVEERFHLASGDLLLQRIRGELLDKPGSADNILLAETRWVRNGIGHTVLLKRTHISPLSGLPVGDGEETTQLAYAANGQVVSVSNDVGFVQSYGYDTAGRVVSITESKTIRSVRLGYRVLGVTVSDTPASGGAAQAFTVDVSYDPCGRLVAAWDTVGNTNRWAYDAQDRVSRTTDPLGNEIRYRYDGRGLCTDTIAYVGPCDADSGGVDRGITINTSHVEYDTQGRVRQVTDVNGHATFYDYDSRDRLVYIGQPDGTMRQLIWSPRSNISGEVDANGTQISYTYDGLDRLIRKDIVCGPDVEPTTTYEAFAFTGLSQLASASNDLSTLSFAYDTLGNTLSLTQDGLSTTYASDPVLNTRTCTCPSGYYIKGSYGPNRELLSVSVGTSEPLTSLASLTYDGPGRLATLTRANGVDTHVLWNGIEGSANAAEDYGWKLASAISHVRGASDVIDERVFHYDRAQNKTLRAITGAYGMVDGTATNTWEYDAQSHLTKTGRKMLSMLDYQVHIKSDGKGNRLAVTNNGVPSVYTRNDTLPDPADFQMDQITSVDANDYTYDAAGNRKGHSRPSTMTLSRYDYSGRLVQVDSLDTGMPEPLVAFDYDPLGRRIAKRTYVGGVVSDTTQYVYGDGEDRDCDGTRDDEILETRKSGGGVSSVTVHVGGASAASYAATGRMLFPPLALVDVASSHVLYTHTDDIGNVLALTDDAGAVVERYDYDDFGFPTFRDAAGVALAIAESPVGNPILFRGMEWDSETGLYYDTCARWKAPELNSTSDRRYMDPAVGQYTTRAQNSVYSGMTSDLLFSESSPWVLKKEEGGRKTPFHNKYRPQFYFRSRGGLAENRDFSSIDDDDDADGITAEATREKLKSYFQTGDIPTQEQFRAAGFGKSHELKGHVTLIK